MIFKYFDSPEILTGLLNNKTRCNSCEKEEFCFDAELFYGEEKITSICPECLASGVLVDRDIYTCDGDIKELKRQLKKINPTLTEIEVEELARQKTQVLEKTTPYLVAWQEWNWPCADGDYCKFIGYGSRPFYEVLATKISSKRLFSNSFYYNLKAKSDIDYLWTEVLSEKEIKDYNESNEYGMLFYVFRSLNSDKIITIWDCG